MEHGDYESKYAEAGKELFRRGMSGTVGSAHDDVFDSKYGEEEQPEEEETSGKADTEWECVHCQSANPSEELQCGMCYSDRPATFRVLSAVTPVAFAAVPVGSGGLSKMRGAFQTHGIKTFRGCLHKVKRMCYTHQNRLSPSEFKDGLLECLGLGKQGLAAVVVVCVCVPVWGCAAKQPPCGDGNDRYSITPASR